MEYKNKNRLSNIVGDFGLGDKNERGKIQVKRIILKMEEQVVHRRDQTTKQAWTKQYAQREVQTSKKGKWNMA